MRNLVFARFCTISLKRTPADQNERQLARVVALPATNLRLQLVAGTTAWIREDQQHRQVRSTQKIQSDYLTVETG